MVVADALLIKSGRPYHETDMSDESYGPCRVADVGGFDLRFLIQNGPDIYFGFDTLPGYSTGNLARYADTISGALYGQSVVTAFALLPNLGYVPPFKKAVTWQIEANQLLKPTARLKKHFVCEPNIVRSTKRYQTRKPKMCNPATSHGACMQCERCHCKLRQKMPEDRGSQHEHASYRGYLHVCCLYTQLYSFVHLCLRHRAYQHACMRTSKMTSKACALGDHCVLAQSPRKRCRPPPRG